MRRALCSVPTACCTWLTVLSGGRIRYARYMGGVGGRTRLRSARVNDSVATGARTILVPDGRQRRGGAGFPGFRANPTPRSTGSFARGGTPVLVTSPPRGTVGSPRRCRCGCRSTRTKPLRPGPGAEAGRSLGRVVVDHADTTTGAFAAGMTSDGCTRRAMLRPQQRRRPSSTPFRRYCPGPPAAGRVEHRRLRTRCRTDCCSLVGRCRHGPWHNVRRGTTPSIVAKLSATHSGSPSRATPTRG